MSWKVEYKLSLINQILKSRNVGMGDRVGVGIISLNLKTCLLSFQKWLMLK